jgi:hypothetical protein
LFLLNSITWCVGLLWSFTFQWPESIESIFLRRCSLVHATHVAIVAPMKKVENIVIDKKFSFVEYMAQNLWCPFNFLLCMIFSYPGTQTGFEVLYCKVDVEDTNIPSFNCRMGRYVYSTKDEKYVPSTIEVGKTIGDFLMQRSGLSTTQATTNYHLVGPNALPLEKPTIIRNIVKEFSNTFYLYQNFLIWTWFPFWYYYMGIVTTCIRVTGGLVAASFQHINDSMLYKLAMTEGQIS